MKGAETLNGTTWGRWHVAGTFDGEAFLLTEVPGSAGHEQDANETDRRFPPVGAEAEKALAVIQEDLWAGEVQASLGAVTYSYIDVRRGVVVAAVWIADKSARHFAKERWGDHVELRSLLKPVG